MSEVIPGGLTKFEHPLDLTVDSNPRLEIVGNNGCLVDITHILKVKLRHVSYEEIFK